MANARAPRGNEGEPASLDPLEVGALPGASPLGRGAPIAWPDPRGEAPLAEGAAVVASAAGAPGPTAAPRGFLARVREGFAHAFSLAPERPALDAEEAAMLDRFADEVVRRGLATPAVLWLESMRPLHFVGAQALYALRPIAHAAIPPEAFDRFTRVLERRDSVEQLIHRIEARA